LISKKLNPYVIKDEEINSNKLILNKKVNQLKKGSFKNNKIELEKILKNIFNPNKVAELNFTQIKEVFDYPNEYKLDNFKFLGKFSNIRSVLFKAGIKQINRIENKGYKVYKYCDSSFNINSVNKLSSREFSLEDIKFKNIHLL